MGTTKRSRRQFGFERLEGRELLSGNGLTRLGAAQQVAPTAIYGTLRAGANDDHQDVGQHDDGEANETPLAASLTTASGAAAGSAKFQSENENGVTKQVLVVCVTGAPASSKLDVSVNGTLLGQVMTDASGKGVVRFTSNPTNATDVALPAGFVLTDGSTIKVGDTITGTFGTGKAPVAPVVKLAAAVRPSPKAVLRPSGRRH